MRPRPITDMSTAHLCVMLPFATAELRARIETVLQDRGVSRKARPMPCLKVEDQLRALTVTRGGYSARAKDVEEVVL